jgi:hypothetical protein
MNCCDPRLYGLRLVLSTKGAAHLGIILVMKAGYVGPKHTP